MLCHGQPAITGTVWRYTHNLLFKCARKMQVSMTTGNSLRFTVKVV